MENLGKASILFLIILISMLAISAVSASDDMSIGDELSISDGMSINEDLSMSDGMSIDEDMSISDDNDLSSIEEVQEIDDANYEISGDSSADSNNGNLDDEVISTDSKSSLGANQLSAPVPGSFKDLQETVDNAGDVLNLTRDYRFTKTDDVATCDYLEVFIKKNITINGNGHTIDGGDYNGVFGIRNSNHMTILGGYVVVLNDINFKGGGQNDQGGSIQNNGHLTVNNCNFTDNIADYIYISTYDSYDPGILHSAEVLGAGDIGINIPTHLGGNGGAIFSRYGTLIVNNCNFNANCAYHTSHGQGGAIYNSEGTVQITNSNFTGNYGHIGGGAIFNWYGTMTISGCQFTNNYIDYNPDTNIQAGAILNSYNSIMTIENSKFVNNHAYINYHTSNAYGGAIRNDASLTINGCEFINNYCDHGERDNTYGGAIYCTKDGTLSINNSNFTGNHAKQNGGAILNEGQTSISNSNFTNNNAKNGDAIFNTKTLTLSNNSVTGTRVAIYNSNTISSKVNAILLDGLTITCSDDSYELYGVLVDDAGNLIQDTNFKFVVNGEAVPYASFDMASGIYRKTYFFKNTGTYIISAKYKDEYVTNGTLIVERPLSILQDLIENADDGDEINLTYGYGYVQSIDSYLKDTGIIVNKNIILNGNGVTINGTDVSRLFKITNNAHLVLNNITLANGYSTSGGAIYIEEGSLNISDSTLVENYADYQGGAIYSNGSLEIHNSSFANNDVNLFNGMGGAIYTANECIISDTNFTQSNGRLGGAIYSQNDMNISNSSFNNNSAGFGGAIFSSGNLDISYSSFSDNNASSSGGSIRLDNPDGKLTADHVRFLNNTAIHGGAIDLCGIGDITDSHFENNSASVNGGAIDNLGSLHMACTNLTDNSAGDKGQAIYNAKELYLISNYVNSTKVAIYNSLSGTINNDQIACLFTDSEIVGALKHNITAILKDGNDNLIQYENFSFFVGDENLHYTSFDEETGVYTLEYTFDDIGTYDISARFNDRIVEAQRTVVNSLSLLQYFIDNAEGDTIDLKYGFEYNEAVDFDLEEIGVIINKTIILKGNDFIIDGKGVSRLFYVTDGGNLSLNELTLQNAYVRLYGGAIYIDKNSTLNIDGCRFEKNKADYGGVIYQSGNANISINNSFFIENRAYFDGPVICINPAETFDYIPPFYEEEEIIYACLNVDNSLFEFNDCVGYGGAIHINNSNVTLSLNNSGFVNNNARYGGAIYSNGEANISNSYFEGNRGSWFGGALYFDVNSSASVDECRFEDCFSDNGGAIYSIRNLSLSSSNFTEGYGYHDTVPINNGGILNLSNNRITGFDVPIYNNLTGKIVSKLNVSILDGEDMLIKSAKYNLTGILKDDMGNIIHDENFKFLVQDEAVPHTSFDVEMGAHIVEYAFSAPGTYTIGADYENADITLAGITIFSLSSLKQLIDENTNGTIDLEFDYPYIPEFDEPIIDGIVINKAITINGNGHIINGSNMARIFNMSSTGWLVLNNLTIANAYSLQDGGAIIIEGGNVTINGSKFIENHANRGGVIYDKSQNSKLKITDSEFSNNTASIGAILVTSTDFEISGTKFLDNHAESMAGAIYSVGSGFIMDSCEFINNSANQGGAITYVGFFKTFTVRNTLFEANSATEGGAFYYSSPGSLLENLRFINNTATRGSAIYFVSGVTNIKNAIFLENKAEESGAIHLYRDAKPSIEDSVFEANTGGAEVYNIAITNDAELDLRNNIFKTVTANIGVDKLVYSSNEDVKVNGSFIWGVDILPIDLRFTELYNSVDYYPQDFKTGMFNYTISGLSDGIYALNILTFKDSNGNQYIVNSSPTDTFRVGDVRLKVVLEINDTNWPDDVIANIYVYEENTGRGIKSLDVILNLGGTEYVLTTDEDGKASKNFGTLPLQNYTAFLVFAGNEVFNNDYAYDSFRVVDTTKLTVNIDDIDVGEDAIATVSLLSGSGQGLTAPVELNIIGYGIFTIIVGEGSGSLNISGLNEGTYAYTASFAESFNYLANVTEEKTFTVHALSDLIIRFDESEINYGDILNATISIRNQSGEVSISNVDILIQNGEETVYETVIDRIDGTYNFVYSEQLLSPGHYTLVITVPAQDICPEISKTFEFDVYSTPLDVDLGLESILNYGQEVVLNISVGNYQEEEFVVKNLTGTASIIITGIDNDFTLEIPNYELSEGKAQVDLTEYLAVGRYKIKVLVDVFGYDTDSVQTDFTLNKDETAISLSVDNITYGENATVEIRLSAINSEDLNETIKVLIDGVEYESKVTENALLSFEVPDLAAGIHSILVSFEGNEHYLPSSNYTIFNVSKKQATIDVVAYDTLKPGSDASVNVTVMDGDKPVEGTVVITVNGEKHIQELIDGKAEFIISGLPANKYEVAAEFLGNENYSALEYEGDAAIDFYKYSAYFDIIIENGTYGDNLKINVENVTDSLGNSLDGIVLIIFYCDGSMVDFTYFNVTGGSGTDTFAAPCAGSLYATAHFYTENHDYDSELKRVSFIVDKAEPTVNIAYDDGKLIISLDGVNDEKLDETLYLSIDDNEPIEVSTENGLNETVVDLGVGDHSAFVVFRGNENYLARSAYTSFKIAKANSAVVEIIPTRDSFAHGEDVVINVTLKDGETGLNGTVILTVDDVDYAVNVSEGIGQVTVKGLVNGIYPVSAKFIGNENYNEAYADEKSVIVNASDEFNVIVTGSEVTYGENSFITVNVTDAGHNPILIDKVNVTIGDKESVLLPVGENGVVDLGKLDVNAYDVTVIVDDGVHVPVTQKATVRVNQATGLIIELDIPEENHYLDDIYLKINITDGNGNLMEQLVKIDIDGQTFSWRYNVTDGEVSLPLPRLNPGDHIVRVVLLNSNYLSAGTEARFRIFKEDPSLEIKADSIKEGETATIEIELYKDVYYVDGYVVLSVNDVDYSIYLAFGYGNLTIDDLPAGNYTVLAKYIGNDYFEEAFAQCSFEVSQFSNVTANIIGAVESIVLTLTDSKGMPVNGTVKVTVDGASKDLKVVDGVLTIPASAGKHNVTVSYPGDASHASTALSKIVNVNGSTPVKKIATKITYNKKTILTFNKKVDKKKNYYIVATLKDAKGNILKNKKLTVFSHGKSYVTKTNAKGQIRFSVCHPRYGDCTHVISFAGDSEYESCFLSAHVKVKKQKVKLIAKKKTFKAKKKVKKFTAILKNSKGKAIQGKKIIFTINKKKYTAKTNKKGKATIKIKLSKRKTYKVKVRFAGDNTYFKKTRNTKVKIK